MIHSDSPTAWPEVKIGLALQGRTDGQQHIIVDRASGSILALCGIFILMRLLISNFSVCFAWLLKSGDGWTNNMREYYHHNFWSAYCLILTNFKFLWVLLTSTSWHSILSDFFSITWWFFSIRSLFCSTFFSILKSTFKTLKITLCNTCK